VVAVNRNFEKSEKSERGGQRYASGRYVPTPLYGESVIDTVQLVSFTIAYQPLGSSPQVDTANEPEVN
jgi:hypothetical protein